MSRYLTEARRVLEDTSLILSPSERNTMALYSVLAHLEQEPENLTQRYLRVKKQSETLSSGAIETAEETPYTSVTSSKWSSRVSLDGRLTQSVLLEIWDWLSSQVLLGKGPAVEIGVTLTSKGSMSPDGSPSPSTEAQSPAVSGHAGDEKLSGVWRCPSPRCETLNYDRYDACIMCREPRPIPNTSNEGV